jgi:hypothetical protein
VRLSDIADSLAQDLPADLLRDSKDWILERAG